MKKWMFLIILMLLLPVSLMAYDPLYYINRSEVLPILGVSGNIALGYFTSSQFWATDTSGNSELYDLSESISLLRVLASGSYGLTRSHTISILVPAYIQLTGLGDSTGFGIVDPWITLDGWIERDPMVIGRASLRIPLKGYLDGGDPRGYRESDPHLAIDGAVTVRHMASSSIYLQGTAGIRYYFSAWDCIPGSVGDSAVTSPGAEFRGTGFIILPVNPELEIRAGLEGAFRGNTDADRGYGEIENSAFKQVDLRAGFSLDNAQLEMTGDLYLRLSGENTLKEWGIMIRGLGLSLGDVFSTGATGR